MRTNYFEWWNFLKRLAARRATRENPAPNAPNQEMQVLPQRAFVEFREDGSATIRNDLLPLGVNADVLESKTEFAQTPHHAKEDIQEMRVLPQWAFLEPHTARIIKVLPMGIDVCLTENKTERIAAPPRTIQDHVELAIKPTQNLWVRALGAYPPKKYADGFLRMEEQYDWVVIQLSVENPGQVELTIISYDAQEAWIDFSTYAVVGHHFNDRILAETVNPVLAEIIQRTQLAEARQPKIAAQIDQWVDELIAQLGRK